MNDLLVIITSIFERNDILEHQQNKNNLRVNQGDKQSKDFALNIS
jgi:hypothetical protein